MPNDREVEKALLVLRLGLGLFMLLWSIDKLVAPDKTVAIFKHFYMLSIPENGACAIGVLEALLSLAIMAGAWKTWSYGLGAVLHGISTLSTYPQLLAPFGKNHLFIAALPVLCAFVALYLLRERDTLWSLDALRAGRGTGRS